MRYILFFILLIPSLSWGATYTADSCSYADVHDKYANSLTDGNDTLNVPAGDCTWDTTFTFSKGGMVMGAGTDQTIIRRGSASPFLSFAPSDYDNNEPFRLSGFYFDFNSGGDSTFKIGRTRSAPFTVQDDFRIDHNVFDEMTGRSFWDYSVARGVIDHNRFVFLSGLYPFKSDPQIADTYDWWVDSPQHDYTLGSDKNLYYEDNVIQMTGSTAGAECQYGGRYAFRYNTWTNTTPSYNFFEMHGHQTSGSMPSCFGAELYGNDITVTNDDNILFKVRGGKSVIFANSGSNISGQWDVVGYVGELVTCPSADPNGQMINNTYQWMNREDYDGNLADTSVSGDVDGCGDHDNRPVSGRDMVGDDTTPGVTYGANLPASCTTYEGFWKTSQDLSDLTNFVGAEPSTPLIGTLYQCTATDTWTEFYTPLQYPHPIVQEQDGVPCEANCGLGVVIDTPTSSATYSTSTTPITLSGTSSYSSTISTITWANSEASTAGTATGTTSWTDTLSLVSGTNTITVTVTATDETTANDVITITYSEAESSPASPTLYTIGTGSGTWSGQ